MAYYFNECLRLSIRNPFYGADHFDSKFSQEMHYCVFVFIYNVPPTAKVIWRRGHGLKSHPTDWWSRESNLRLIPGLQGKRFIHYTTAAPEMHYYHLDCKYTHEIILRPRNRLNYYFIWSSDGNKSHTYDFSP